MDLRNIGWMPIDVPKFDKKEELIADFHDDFKDTGYVGKTHDMQIQRVVTRSATPDRFGQSAFETKFYTEDDLRFQEKELTPTQRDLLEYCKKYIPIFDPEIRLHKIGPKGMAMHLDFLKYIPGTKTQKNPEFYDHIVANEPCGFRMKVRGTLAGELKAMRGNQEEGYDWDNPIVPRMPTDTDWFVLNSTSLMHGTPDRVADNIDTNDRYILLVIGWPDVEKLDELLTRSAEKYKNLVLTM